jgi:hypothetical protein
MDETELLKNSKRKMSSYKKILYSIFFCLIIGLLIVGYWKYYFTFSEGYRTGLIQKLSYKGNFFKTYEGELVLSSIVSSNNIALAVETASKFGIQKNHFSRVQT